MTKIAPVLCLVLACGTSASTSPPAPDRSPPSPADRAAPPPLDGSAAIDAGAWSYASLAAGERAVIDRGRAAAGWQEVQRGFAAAVRAGGAR